MPQSEVQEETPDQIHVIGTGQLEALIIDLATQ